MTTLPPQRQGKPIGGRGPGQQPSGGGRGLSPAQGAQEAERRLGKPCFFAGQMVKGLFGCVTCQFQIRNRGRLPACPQCGELVWAYMEAGPRPVPEDGPDHGPPPPAAPAVQEGVKLEAPSPGPVKVEEGIKLEP